LQVRWEYLQSTPLKGIRMATKKRSTMAKLKRALMKDIDEREAEEDAKSFVSPWYPFDGVTAKSALRKASDANIDRDYKRDRPSD
jgi:hypothetical protein